MGLDFTCIAVPLDAEPVRAIRADPVLWAVADGQPPFSRPWPGEELPEISRRLLAVVPGGTRWRADWFEGRNHQLAEHLLDPIGRDPDPAHRAIFGAERFAEHAVSGQGIGWRCSTAAQLSEAVRLIDGLDVEAARVSYRPDGLYKAYGASFEQNLRDLRSWADHCRDVAARGLDLIITLY
ncbi:hypothetical protein [Actinoplanes sp. G11-F43]|uniref:hypothetical protein n=1 Tax=Actinoplanes sp. G11-F43 TaxID=3424130 RepID=UPI003D353310